MITHSTLIIGVKTLLSMYILITSLTLMRVSAFIFLNESFGMHVRYIRVTGSLLALGICAWIKWFGINAVGLIVLSLAFLAFLSSGFIYLIASRSQPHRIRMNYDDTDEFSSYYDPNHLISNRIPTFQSHKENQELLRKIQSDAK